MSLLSQLGTMFLADEKTAVLPEVQSFFQFSATNGIALGGISKLGAALVAVEAAGVSGLNQFVKDSSSIIVNYIGTALAQKSQPTATQATQAPTAH